MIGIPSRVTNKESGRDITDALLGLLQGIIGQANDEVADAIHYCAITHWFNEETIAAMRGEKDCMCPSTVSQEILADLQNYVFVAPYNDFGFAYDPPIVREALLSRWRSGDAGDMRLYGRRAIGYLDRKLEKEDDGRKRQRFVMEKMYLLLQLDVRQGIDLFEKLFEEAGSLYRFSTCQMLVDLAEEQFNNLDIKQRYQLSAYGKWLRTEGFICFKTGIRCNVRVQEAPDLVYVLMPLDSKYNNFYIFGVQDVVQQLGLKCKRVDEVIHNRDIMCEGVCKNLRRARCVVADLSGRDSNVFYELGLSHGFQKPVILITQTLEDVPFDLRSLNVIEYKGDISFLRKELESSLKEVLGLTE